ncbi:sensor histidine kinase [Paenibacillus rhizoplanae]
MIPTRELLQEVRKADRQVIGIGLLCLLLSALLAYFFIRNMIRPVRRLIQEMRKLERGDFRASMSESLTEEYTQMSYGFNHMVNRLQELVQSEREASAAKREAQAGLLEAQIKPHFLYNTLDMIHWKAMDYDAQDISYMITQLGKNAAHRPQRRQNAHSSARRAGACAVLCEHPAGTAADCHRVYGVDCGPGGEELFHSKGHNPAAD